MLISGEFLRGFPKIPGVLVRERIPHKLIIAQGALSTSPGAARLPCPSPPPLIRENGWVGVFEPSDSESGIAFARFRPLVPESASGDATMLPPISPSISPYPLDGLGSF